MFPSTRRHFLQFGAAGAAAAALPMSGWSADVKAKQRVIIERIDHVMVCVKDLKESSNYYAELFGTVFYPVEPYALGKFGIRKAALDATGIELAEAAPDGEAAQFIKRAGEAVLGIAFKVPDLAEAVAAMQSQGVRLNASEEGATRKAAVFHPQDAFGAMIKLVEYLPTYSVADLEVVTLWRQLQGLPAMPEEGKKPRIAAEKIDHIIFSIKDLDAARKFYGDLFVTKFPEPHATKGEGPTTKMAVDGWGIELIQQRKEKPREDAVAAVSFKVSNFADASAALKAREMTPGLTRDLPTRKVALYGPKGMLGMGIELIEYRPLAHPIVGLDMREALLKRRPK